MEVHQSLNETMHLFDECVEELIYLLTNFYMVAMDTQSKHCLLYTSPSPRD